MAASSLKDRIPPHNDEAEQATLGALLLDDDAISVAIRYLRADDFYSNANRRIFQAILNLFNKGRKADIITVVDELRLQGELDSSGGPAYVASLTSVVPTSANIDYYARIVQDRSIRRTLLKISADVTAQSFDDSNDSRMVVEEAQRQIFELTDNRQTLTFKSAKEPERACIQSLCVLRNGTGRGKATVTHLRNAPVLLQILEHVDLLKRRRQPVLQELTLGIRSEVS